jgi:hypothetical protein
MTEAPVSGTLWRHRKGGLYVVTGACRIEATGDDAVLYTPVGGGPQWARPVAEFLDGRFRPVAPGALAAAEEGPREG